MKLLKVRSAARVAFLAAMVFSMIMPPLPLYGGSAYATDTPVKCDYDFYSANDIVRYDPCAAVCAPSGSTDGVTLEDSKETAEAVFKYLISTRLSSNSNKPLNAFQAAGFLGNMYAESGVDPTAIQSGQEYDEERAMGSGGGYAFGLVQWDGGRRAGLLKYAKTQGKEWTDLATQLTYLKKELENSEKKIIDDPTFAATNDPATAAVRIRVVFERAGIPHDTTRQKAATTFYNEFKNLAPGEIEFGSGGRCSFGAGNGDIAETAIALAWPKKVNNGYFKNKPEYQKALEETGVSKLGDSCSMGGNSCDAFVATVMRYSGADTEFPCCGANMQGNYMNKNSDKYQAIGHITSTKNLQAGDILWRDGHIKIYIGDGRQADASHCQRTASIAEQTYFDGFYYAFRSTSQSKGVAASDAGATP